MQNLGFKKRQEMRMETIWEEDGEEYGGRRRG